MSYSYIKSVFPNFETSKEYDKNVFNSLYSGEAKTTVNYQLPKAYDEDDISSFAKSLINDNKTDINSGIQVAQTKLNEPEWDPNTYIPETTTRAPQARGIEGYHNVHYGRKEGYENAQFDYNHGSRLSPRDNVMYYKNAPLPTQYISPNNNILKHYNEGGNARPRVNANKNTVEHFESDEKIFSGTCEDYLKHTLECSKCKSILMKQFNVEGDRLRNEEIMEVISYMIFGLFILLLIDNLSKK